MFVFRGHTAGFKKLGHRSRDLTTLLLPAPNPRPCARQKILAYCPPSDFRVNVEAGLRTALSLGLTFLWLRFGPFHGGLSFFAGVTAIVCVGNSAGQTISRSLVSAFGHQQCGL